MTMKWCFKCKQHKPTNRFKPDGRMSDGLYDRCINCSVETLRKCKACGDKLPIDKFGFYNQEGGYRFHTCKPCRNNKVKSYRGNDDRYKDYMRLYMRLKRAK